MRIERGNNDKDKRKYLNLADAMINERKRERKGTITPHKEEERKKRNKRENKNVKEKEAYKSREAMTNARGGGEGRK